MHKGLRPALSKVTLKLGIQCVGGAGIGSSPGLHDHSQNLVQVEKRPNGIEMKTLLQPP